MSERKQHDTTHGEQSAPAAPARAAWQRPKLHRLDAREAKLGGSTQQDVLSSQS
ncbi:MAG: hypothetical protein WDM86_11360 [Rhizomicrobium sp.]